MSSSRLATVLVALLLVGSVLAVPVGSVAAAEDGMVGVPDSNIVEDLPVGADTSLSAADLEGSTMASNHADSLQVVVTTPDRASDYTNGSEISGGSSGVALVFQDDSEHEGRRVGVPAEAIRAAVGHIPDVVRGVHESGERWTRPVEARNGMLFFEIPKFSSNSVVFDGSYRYSATAVNGSTNNYNLSTLDGVSKPQVTFTGVLSKEWDNESATGVTDQETVGLSIAGTGDPTGPSGSPEVTVTGNPTGNTKDAGTPGSEGNTVTFSSANVEYINSVYVFIGDMDETAETCVVTVERNGAEVGSGSKWVGNAINTNMEFDVNADVDESDEITLNANDGCRIFNDASLISDAPSDVTIAANGGGDSTTLNGVGTGTVSDSINLTTDTTEVTVTAQSGSADVSVDFQEVSGTNNPSVELNDGHYFNHTGDLADGETVTVNGSEDWLQVGNNDLVTTVGDGSLPADAPEPKVQVEYQHGASDTVLVEYAANGWRERYNVSKSYSSDRENPTATIEFDRTVHEVQYVETSVNGGSWSTVPAEDWTLQNGSTLVVDLDDGDGDGKVDAGDQIGLRVSGLKLQVENGAITVVEPTVPGDSNLDSEVRIDEKSSGFQLGVGGTRLGDRLHYTHSESWSEADEYARFEDDGTQQLRFPNAGAGDTFRVTTVPLEVYPSSGDVSVHVSSADGPTFAVVPDGQTTAGDSVTFKYVATTAGETYQLYSVSKGRVVSKAEATSDGAVLDDNDGGETFRIELAEGSSSSSSDGGGTIGGGGQWAQQAAGTTIQEGAVVVGWVVLVVLLVAATARSSLRGQSRWVLVAALGGGSGLLAIEVLRPGAISSSISGGLEQIIPLAGLAGIGIGGYAVVSWLQAREKEAGTPETSVTFDLNDD